MSDLVKLNSDSTIEFFADKVYVHRWPQNSPIWSKQVQEKIDLDLNKNNEKKKVLITTKKIRVSDYDFLKIKKVGVTVPLFKKETTLVFEGNFQNLDAHVHITTLSSNYLEIFNSLMAHKSCFSDSD